jgi:hypothetical protein
MRIKDKAGWPPNEEEQIPWLIWHPVKLAKTWEHLKATREPIPYKEFRLEDWDSIADDFLAIDDLDSCSPSLNLEPEDHSLEVLISMDLEEEETLEEAEPSSPADHNAGNGHELKSFIPPTDLDCSEMTADLVEYFVTSHRNVPMVYCDYKSEIKFYVDKLHQKPYCWSFEKIGRVFSILRAAIHRHYRRMCAGTIQPIRRPNLMTTDELEQLHQLILAEFINHRPVTYSQIQEFIENNHRKFITNDTLVHILRRMSWRKTVTGVPIEIERLTCSETEIAEYFDTIERLLNGVLVKMVFNVDETGFQPWADKRNIAVVVPSEYPNSEIQIGVDRVGQRTSMIVCIGAGDARLKPLVAIGRETYEAELLELGFDEEQCLIGHEENGFVNFEPFLLWVERIFVPEVERIRAEIGYGGYAFLIMDSYTCHKSDAFEELCTIHGIHVIILPPHSSDQTQPLDLSIFGLQKRELATIHPRNDLNPQTYQLVWIMCALQKAATPPNVVGAFKRAGICSLVDPFTRERIVQIQRGCADKVRLWNPSKSRIRADD